ncbi:hypothetical protein K435DRAFT_724797 [Dendrothele bispora CBS 962.96]|uniref:RRM Nup35-type domain-containing protein n=1 Tax=Dendrothele bispora (strain CBS 962.96) TaxID=1314807 RepID=A0A4S8LY21_DENBC|nr:hypothetical protein K435DRAFT_724797 [Dendrothele bispora CBS 962.96]
MFSNSFTVAGMSSSTSSHHNPNLNVWGNNNVNPSGGLGASSFGDSLSQSRSHYQSGYLLSASQANASPQGHQRVDEVPVVPTKAKMNHALMRGSTSEFGMDSMFESSARSRQPRADDEDAPPTMSVNDIPNQAPFNPTSSRFQPKVSTAGDHPFSFSASRRPRTPTAASSTSSAPLYVIVFGYPADKYSVTVEYFKSLGATTDADPNTEIVNCFRIGYQDPGDAMRAVRKNGEVLGGSWMIGAKWADPAQAEALLGQPIQRSGGTSEFALSTSPPTTSVISSQQQSNNPNAMVIDSPSTTVGTPIKLAPSSSVFRKPGPTGLNKSQPQTPQPATAGVQAQAPPANPSPSKGIVGQVSDLIFGW